ncbi:hypothetical protein AA313_de0208163 [Arthrobotrys entomopaga]|nr:hypothetical protein AA313_de0208163 [Arthrobotrys entomopaga]
MKFSILTIFALATAVSAGQWYCSPTDPCNPGMVCDSYEPDQPKTLCFKILGEGGVCGGAMPPPRKCGPGLVCQKNDPNTVYGKCVKATTPSARFGRAIINA